MGELHICIGTGRRFLARARWRGCRNYQLLGRPTKSYRVALHRLADAFAGRADYKRGDILMTADYYDPVQICELVQR